MPICIYQYSDAGKWFKKVCWTTIVSMMSSAKTSIPNGTDHLDRARAKLQECIDTDYPEPRIAKLLENTSLPAVTIHNNDKTSANAERQNPFASPKEQSEYRADPECEILKLLKIKNYADIGACLGFSIPVTLALTSEVFTLGNSFESLFRYGVAGCMVTMCVSLYTSVQCGFALEGRESETKSQFERIITRPFERAWDGFMTAVKKLGRTHS